MRDQASPPIEAGEYLRRILAARRRRRARLLAAALAGCTAIPLSLSVPFAPAPFLVWNASSSAPTGLYRLRAAAVLGRDDMVAARLAGPDRWLAARRGYLPPNVPLVKRVAALAGDRVCAAGRLVTINGRIAAARRRLDPAGRPMPWWTGCRRLRPGEVFLLTPSPLSFDGRYFGVSRKCSLLGRAEPLWVR